MQRTGRKTTYVWRSIYSSLSKVEVGGHRNESASKMFASWHTMGSAMGTR